MREFQEMVVPTSLGTTMNFHTAHCSPELWELEERRGVGSIYVS